MSRLDALVFFCRRRVCREAARVFLVDGVKAGCDSFCVAGVAFPDILTCLQKR